MAYKIVFKKSAVKELKKLDSTTYARLRASIDKLATNPKPSSSKKMVNSQAYRLRVGSYRVIYEIDHGIVTIYIIKVAHRSEVYIK